MENKYYTPEISEFHVGFEYELNLLQKTWEKLTFMPSHFDTREVYAINWKSETKQNTIRVKFIDHNDIISLGWTNYDNTKTHIGFTKLIYSEKYNKEIELQLGFNPTNNWIYISEQIEHTRFAGIIKNKSQLKILLKQLQII